MANLGDNDKLVQFLMGLNDACDHVKNQISLLDPLPSINKAYSMILRVEKQREVHVVTEFTEASAMLANNKGNREIDGGRVGMKNYEGKNGFTRK